MGLSTWLLMLVTHPLEFRTLLQYHIYREQKRDITAPEEHATSGWDRATMQRCWYFLDMTSRSFSSVIKELEGDMARVVCMFYLVLRALDTIEDDMTLSSSVKQPLLRNFPAISSTPGWTFTESGPDEKDRQLLVEYTVVTEELGNLQPAYRDAIMSIAEKMGRGMADFVAREESEKATPWLESIADYDLYCHYVAGLVGEGLSLLFAASGKESPHLAGQLELSNSMGLLLQKTNITRDFREDVDERRYFWPREIWAGERYGGGFSRPEEMCTPPPGTVALPGVAQRALWVQSAMVLDALRHATDALDYLRLLKNQSIFNFVAIPATMAIATLELCFMNPQMFARNIKIRKAVAASLIMRSTNPREVSFIFREYVRKIHARAVPADPNFIRLSVACGKIEQWCEHYYPSFVLISAAAGGGLGGMSQSIDRTDARGRTFLAYEKAETERAQALRVEQLRKDVANGKRQPLPSNDVSLREVLMYLGAGALVLVSVIGGVVYMIMKMSD
ncbi:farnesyl-diphosphate farnesyltransferase [Mycena polygramma]|nr:farnesyl-diphosphate farnesyltransferase [Mycena polygramma]